MTARAWVAMLAAMAAACGSPPPPAPAPAPAPPPAAAVPDDREAEDADAGAPAPAAETPTEAPVIAAAPPLPPSTASYEQATSVPEPLIANDDRLQLTDIQLHEPMRGVLSHCRVPPSAKVTIKTAVQQGRAIGVTVLVELPKPKAPKKAKKPSKKSQEAAKARAKAVADLVSCADHAVRVLTWPPSRRRDAFTTTF